MRSCSFPVDDVIIARLDIGEDVLVSIQQVVKEHEITAGLFSLIGAVDRANYGFYDPENRTYLTQTWEPAESTPRALEILVCIGNIARLEGEIIVHGHITLKGFNQETIGGHLMEGCQINPTGELTILKAKGTLHRRRDAKLNLALLDL